MARIRSVHPSLFTDEAWVSCSPLARILYIGLWTDADDQGLFEWKPLQIKMRLLPGDAGDVPSMLAELEACGLIMSYEVDGKRFGAIANFRKFQRPQKPNALYPLAENVAEYVGLPATAPEPVSDQSRTDPVIPPLMEDGGGRGEVTTVADAPVVVRAPKPKSSRRCPDAWVPSEGDLAAEPALTSGEIERELAKFRDHTFATARTDWSATFRNWIRRAAESKPRHERTDPRTEARSVWSDIIADRHGADAGAAQPLRIAG